MEINNDDWQIMAGQEREEFIRRYVAGEALTSLAREYHHGPATLRAILVSVGVPVRTRPGYAKGRKWSEAQREAHRRTTSTPEHRQKMRAIMLKRLPVMRGAATNSPIERRMQDALMAVGIGFTTQSVLLDRYLVDIEIHQAPIVIEADGAQHTLRIQKAKDAERDTALTAAGYRVFRFTGSEINADAVLCVRRVIDACFLVPDQEPIYEIRTAFTGELHPLWKGGKREFTCEICGVVFMAQPAHRKGPHIYCSMQCNGAAKRGKTASAETRAKISAANRGKERKPPPPFTAEHRAKISAGLKGRPKTAEHAAKVGAAQAGRPKSAETRAKISETLKRRNANQNKIESALHGDMQRPAEMTGPATLF